MGLLHHDVTLLNFDGAYARQPNLTTWAHEWIDLADIREANLFCSQRARGEISRRLSGRRGRGITFIGNGNYHYVTHLLISEIQRPFTLILFDNHTDARKANGMPGLLNCGSWVADSTARLPHLQRVVIVGACTERPGAAPAADSKILLLSQAEISQLPLAIPNQDVYISIDKDVLDPAYAATNWDHGTMPLAELLAALKTLIRQKNVLGVDVCGELPVRPGDVWRQAGKLKLNERANLAILQSVLSA